MIPLDRPDTVATIARHSPSGRVPALIDGDLTICDSLAIAEYCAEKFPRARLWPEDAKARAVARSICAEMHSGFDALRTHHCMKIKDSLPVSNPRADVKADLARLSELWADARKKYGKGGPFLFGAWTHADAFFAPVATRVRTYALPVDAAAREYLDAVWNDAAVQEWVEGARRENMIVPRYERGT